MIRLITWGPCPWMYMETGSSRTRCGVGTDAGGAGDQGVEDGRGRDGIGLMKTRRKWNLKIKTTEKWGCLLCN